MCDREKASSAMMPLNGRVIGIDPCIAHIVAALNAGGVWTKASCCGHGGQPLDHGDIVLDDGRILVVLESQADYEARFGPWVKPDEGVHVHQIENRCECGDYYVDGRWMPSGKEEGDVLPYPLPGQCAHCGNIDRSRIVSVLRTSSVPETDR